MNRELLYRIAFASVIMAYSTIRIPYQLKSQKIKKSEGYRLPMSSSIKAGLMATSILFLIIVYVFHPETIGFFQLEIADHIRVMGFVASMAGILALFAIHRHLGRNFSPTLYLHQKHDLVTTGPYRFIRHPMYTAMLMIVSGLFLLSANTIIGLFGIGTISLIILVRTPQEERQLEELFGEKYLSYKKGTGYLLPPLSIFRFGKYLIPKK
ncbi:MAG: isoprenylcysteine carboxylmethyltransferase family protein [Oligoflexales bacterium]|nr:isoprenylcysteine carboxylmethyltransferase family protein [Oligoflexales bacterium]